MDQGEPSSDTRHVDWGALIVGLLILAVGGYLLLKDTFKVDVPDISWEAFWPVVLIALGLVIVLRTAGRGTRRSRRRDR